MTSPSTPSPFAARMGIYLGCLQHRARQSSARPPAGPGRWRCPRSRGPGRAPGPASARSGAPRALPSDGCAGHRQGIGADLKDQQTPSADEVCRQSRGWRCSSTNSCDRRSKRSTRPVKGVRVSKRSVVFLLNQST